jgi:hypothetical protein
MVIATSYHQRIGEVSFRNAVIFNCLIMEKVLQDVSDMSINFQFVHKIYSYK